MYCMLGDLLSQTSEQVLIGLTDDDNQMVNQNIVDSAIQTAGSEIDGYAQKQYSVPFDPVPEIIKKISVDITLYNLFSRRGFDKEKDANIMDRYKNAVRFLQDLARGVVTIGVPNPAPPIAADIRSNPRVFNRNSMEGF